MLGSGAISSRAIAGSVSLILVSLTAAASGNLLTVGGTTNPGIILPGQATGTILQFSGSASPFWLQAATTQGTFLILSGSANLYMLGKPIVLTGYADPNTPTAQAERFTVNALADVFSAKGF